MIAVNAWGRLSNDLHQLRVLEHPEQVARHIHGQQPGLAYGNGRSYGDVCLNPGGPLWHTAGLNKFISFDEQSGRLTCEAGLLLRDIQRVCMPRGWMLAVTPGTQLITVGGAIANDVHGKNHHEFGTFGDHVIALTLALTDGQLLHCDRHTHADLMHATIGGLGLTGVVVQATLQLRRTDSPWLRTETIPFEGIPQFCSLADASVAQWEHTVAWIDCLSGGSARGLFLRGRPASAEDLNGAPQSISATPPKHPSDLGSLLQLPFVPPFSLVNRFTLRPFNSLYFHLKKRLAPVQLAHYESFFYPLDGIQNWNRMYGPRGFFQYQCVVPFENGSESIEAILDAIARSGEGSFLAVLKTFGHRQAAGMLSFAMPGITLALDFTNRGARTLQLFERLDAIVLEAKGRLYPAKDARMPRQVFELGYPMYKDFAAFRDPGISSAMSRRLMDF